MKNILTAACICLALLAISCNQPNPKTLDRLIIGEVMMNSEFSTNLRFLAMDHGRLSGSANGKKAEEYVLAKLKEYGLHNVHFEPFEMLTWQDKSTSVSIVGDPPTPLEGALALGNSQSTPPGGITGELIDIGKGTKEDFATFADKMRGKFVLTGQGALHRGAKMALAVENGAIGMLHVSRLDDRPQVGTCHSKPHPEPGIAIKGSDGALLSRMLADGQVVKVNVKVDAESWLCNPRNVIAEIPGTGPHADEIIILGAHLDSWHLAQGAMDNGAGSATILETARALATSNWKPNRTVRFIWFMGEEHGLFGCHAYADQHRSQMDNIAAMINVDMPGAPVKFASFEHDEIHPFLKELTAELAGFEMSDDIANAHWTASDHAPFMRQGICTLALYGDLGEGVKYYHSTGDKYEEVDRQGTTESAAVLAVLVRRLADSDPFPAKRLEPQEPDSRTSW